MKNKAILLLTSAALLMGLIGCVKKPSTSSNSNSDASSTTSTTTISQEPDEYGYGFYNNYYGSLTWTSGADLKQKLHDIIRNGWNPLRYNVPNWETNTYADHAKYDFEYVDAVYSANDIEASLTQRGWQREHAFAASLMTGQLTSEAVKTLGRATDFHNLFAGEAGANGSRGNKNFGVADKTAASYQDRTVNSGEDGYSFDSKTFEPANKDKGRLARAIFYMGTMYKDDEDGYKGLTIVEENVEYSATTQCQFAIGHLSELLTWANTYSVDFLEMQHNESVYSHVYAKDNKAQGNRNPFVDYPGLVDYVYGSKQNESGDLKYLKPACYDLGSNKDEFSNYAIGQAQRMFSYGETLTADKFTIYKVNKNYTYTTATSTEYTHSLLNHTFSQSDGSSIEAVVTAGSDTLKYTIVLDPLASCSYHFDDMKNTGISKSSPNTDQNVTYGDVDFTINFAASGTITCTNTSAGGFKMGSSTVPVTGVTLKTKGSYTINKVYFKCYAANTSSSYTLSIKVGDQEVYSGTIPYGKTASLYGTDLSSSMSGQITYTFTGSNAINLNAVAFNVVS